MTPWPRQKNQRSSTRSRPTSMLAPRKRSRSASASVKLEAELKDLKAALAGQIGLRSE